VAAVTNRTDDDIFENVPLRQVYAWEHCHYRREGMWTVPVGKPHNSLEEIMQALLKS
jgi:hypothetical protein